MKSVFLIFSIFITYGQGEVLKERHAMVLKSISRYSDDFFPGKIKSFASLISCLYNYILDNLPLLLGRKVLT